ncbi:MAG: efflux RND transporter periplasmic adaptor subunit [Bacteroidales bacterium]|jgi:HlyD family secretion protein|nr:efflux RND transporter periplasmic adaptor subunit [Bacteroidales bacterium]HOO67257.1 efflux RND transporter periplasmic adaptor subunit [Bacteroidales bacterium]HPJ05966.1 efflux RND transporter periplasmic adaptor subunit [Bacteroidales bacterium]HPQ64548.1 efflux RND transporter periplasmic adaptor subunit [Bacteroidales bacterium]HRW28080.1 efflux RND transporter periplasmic adaptor subunit [Bacteroidales bacterium]
MKQNKILRILIPAVILLLILAVIGKKAGWFGKEATIKVATEKVAVNPIIEAVTANGKIQPETEVKISPDVSGEIVELHVKEGDFVQKGTLLFKIKPEIYISSRDRAAATLNSTRARLAQVEAQLIQAELAYNRSKKLYEENTISQADFEQAESQYKIALAEKQSAEFSVKSSEASLKEANENLVKTTVYSPMTGTISSLLVELGERVVGANMMTGTEVLRVADLNRMEVVVDVNENDIIRVKLGDTAIVEVDAYLDREFKGIVTEIANSANTLGTTSDQVTNFKVRILILKESYEDLITEKNPSPFRPGMSASVDIYTSSKAGVLTVPIQAVTTRTDTLSTDPAAKDNIRTLVFVSDGTYALARDVRIGIQDNVNIEVLSGLTEGEEVIVQPFSAISKKLSDSTRIEVVDKDALFSTGKKE